MASPTPIKLDILNCTVTPPGDSPLSKVFNWGIGLWVSDGPAKQKLCVTPSTVVNSTLLMACEVCGADNLNGTTVPQCRSRRGGCIDHSAFAAASMDRLPKDPGWPTLQLEGQPGVRSSVGSAIEEPLLLRADDEVEVVEGLITTGQEHAASHFGLGDASSVLHTLVAAGRIAGRLWSINAGSQSQLNPRAGSLILGGWDDSSIRGPWSEFKMDYPKKVGLGERICPVQVTIKEWVVRIPGQSDTFLAQKAQPLRACIEP